MFLEYENAEQAALAVEKMDKTPMDKSHTYRVVSLAQFEEILNKTPDIYTPPPRQTNFTAKDNLTSFLLDEEFRDQYVVRHDNETKIYWNDIWREEKRVLVFDGKQHKEERRRHGQQPVCAGSLSLFCRHGNIEHFLLVALLLFCCTFLLFHRFGFLVRFNGPLKAPILLPSTLLAFSCGAVLSSAS